MTRSEFELLWLNGTMLCVRVFSHHGGFAGQKIFLEALLGGTMAGFFKLMEEFRYVVKHNAWICTCTTAGGKFGTQNCKQKALQTSDLLESHFLAAMSLWLVIALQSTYLLGMSFTNHEMYVPLVMSHCGASEHQFISVRSLIYMCLPFQLVSASAGNKLGICNTP
jgi:hypothetical protein